MPEKPPPFWASPFEGCRTVTLQSPKRCATGRLVPAIVVLKLQRPGSGVQKLRLVIRLFLGMLLAVHSGFQ